MNLLQPKTKSMKPSSPSREILLVTTSSFSARQFCEKEPQDKSASLSPAERLEAACWNGLLNEIVPEIMDDTDGEEKIYLWQVETRSSYLKLNLGTVNPEFEVEFTIDPNVLIYRKEMN